MDETVKGLAWQTLRDDCSAQLDAERWDRLVASIGGPDVAHIEPDDNLPLHPFNTMLNELDQRLGHGDGGFAREAGAAAAQAWGKLFGNLVAQLQGRPGKLLEIFVAEAHPYLLDNPRAARLTEMEADTAELVLDSALHPEFKVGLLEGFVTLVGGAAAVTALADQHYRVSWEVEEQAQPSRAALALNMVRAPFLTATVIPILLGTLVAYQLHAEFDLLLLILALVGTCLFHLGTNVINDYFDHRSGVDEGNLTPTPFSGGSRVIQRGLAEPAAMRRLGLGLYGSGTAVGLMIWALLDYDPLILAFGVTGLAVGYFYTAPPFRLAHHGLGELAVGFGFGPLIVLGAYYVQVAEAGLTADWWYALYASLPVALLITAVLYINEFPDRRWDDIQGKRNWVVRLGAHRALPGYPVLVGTAYSLIVIGALTDPLGYTALMPWSALLAVVTLPLFMQAWQRLQRDFDRPYRLIPANGQTIMLHLFTGLLLCAGYLAAGLWL